MKFSCEKALLQSAIAVTSRAVAQKSSIPALEGLLLHADSRLQPADRHPYEGLRRCNGTWRDCFKRPPLRRHHSPDARRCGGFHRG